MSKDLEGMGISPEIIQKLADAKRDVDSGEIDDEGVKSAIDAIELAGKVMNSIMSGEQIDPVFFKSLLDKKKAELQSEKRPPKSRIKKRRRFKRKSKDSV